MQTNFDFLTGRKNNVLENYQDHLLHSEMITSFKELQRLAKDEAGIDLKIISSFRSFQAQKSIWNKKVSGERKVFDDNEKEVNLELLSDFEKVNAITRFSAIPGTSRHHWGTDIDVFDQSCSSRDNVALQPSEYSDNGIFSNLNSWLTEKITNNHSFGFFRPYKEDQGGIHPEAWHLSYSPLSQIFKETYSLEVFEKNIELSDIALRDTILKNIEYYYDKLIIRVDAPFQM